MTIESGTTEPFGKVTVSGRQAIFRSDGRATRTHPQLLIRHTPRLSGPLRSSSKRLEHEEASHGSPGSANTGSSPPLLLLRRMAKVILTTNFCGATRVRTAWRASIAIHAGCPSGLLMAKYVVRECSQPLPRALSLRGGMEKERRRKSEAYPAAYTGLWRRNTLYPYVWRSTCRISTRELLLPLEHRNVRQPGTGTAKQRSGVHWAKSLAARIGNDRGCACRSQVEKIELTSGLRTEPVPGRKR